MTRSDQAFIFFVNRLAGRLNRRQRKVIDLVIEENRIFRSRLEGEGLRRTDDASKQACTTRRKRRIVA